MATAGCASGRRSQGALSSLRNEDTYSALPPKPTGTDCQLSPSLAKPGESVSTTTALAGGTAHGERRSSHSQLLTLPDGFCAHGSGSAPHQPYGSVLRPRYCTPKCRCGPVAQP